MKRLLAHWCLQTSLVITSLICLLLSNANAQNNQYSENFWKYWGDGKAELSAYSLEYPRYSESRRGTAITIFVTEDFSEKTRVKSDRSKSSIRSKSSNSDVRPVMKLNLVQNFQTGIYDYNLMLSSFIAASDSPSFAQGFPLKTSFSSQEWCGHVYHQRLYEADSIAYSFHSYFEGEADDSGTIFSPPKAVSADNLLLWARGLAHPFVKPGDQSKAKLLTSMEIARLKHTEQNWNSAIFSRADDTSEITLDGKNYKVRQASVKVSGSISWNFKVESDFPYRIITYSNSDGLKAKLLNSIRAPYWSMNREGMEQSLQLLGLPVPNKTTE